MKIQQKNILIAPLNWGLGHATRCIPIIKALENNNFTPIIASDGAALQFLKLEFPHLQFLELPSYKIVYPKNGKNFRWKMLQNIPNIILAVAKAFSETSIAKTVAFGRFFANAIAIQPLPVPISRIRIF